jgi:DNA-binding NarL/FixJ family response regulator
LEGGTLFISRKTNVFSWLKSVFENCGFRDVNITSLDRDALTFKLIELKPKYVFIQSEFYSCVTPFMIGCLLDELPDLRIIVVNFGNFPDNLAVRFIQHGAESYLDFTDGVEEFINGLKLIYSGENYYSPGVYLKICKMDKLPKLKTRPTDREWYVLLLVCNGSIDEGVMDNLEISRRTVDKHINKLNKKLDTGNRTNLVRKAIYLEWVKKDELVFNCNDLNIPKNPTKKRIKKIAPLHGGGAFC